MENIGAWLGILRTITYFAVILNVNFIKHKTMDPTLISDISDVIITVTFCQALIIAISSEFIQRLYYENFVSTDGNQAGFVDFTLTG